MNIQTANIIRGIWDGIECLDPDISTEKLMAMTAWTASQQLDKHFDNADVADALILTTKKETP